MTTFDHNIAAREVLEIRCKWTGRLEATMTRDHDGTLRVYGVTPIARTALDWVTNGLREVRDRRPVRWLPADAAFFGHVARYVREKRPYIPHIQSKPGFGVVTPPVPANRTLTAASSHSRTWRRDVAA